MRPSRVLLGFLFRIAELRFTLQNRLTTPKSAVKRFFYPVASRLCLPLAPDARLKNPGHHIEMRNAMQEEDDKDRLFVTALARGLQVLAAFRPGESALSNLEIAKRTGLPKSTVSRLTYTLTTLGICHRMNTAAFTGWAWHCWHWVRWCWPATTSAR
jgi:hypothetical protein